MGVLFKDIRQGRYYKGYDAPAPQGKKCFYFIEQVQTTGTKVTFAAWLCTRKVPVLVWHCPFGPVSGNADDSSLLKERVSSVDVAAEGVPPCPVFATPKPNAAPSPVPTSKPSAPKFASAADLAAQAKALRNEGKVAIPENAKSQYCKKCGGVNKELALFSFTSFWCQKCEPE
jgi:hypothetical protein